MRIANELVLSHSDDEPDDPDDLVQDRPVAFSSEFEEVD